MEEGKLKVASLIKNGCWDLKSIDSKISQEEKELILKIPISHIDREDQAVWVANRDGVYSIKSGYMVARRLAEVIVIRDLGTSFNTPKSLWKFVWRVIVPPKV